MSKASAQDFDFQATSQIQGKLSDYRGKWVVLYFYPRDATPGCTTEGQDFRDQYPEFQKCHAEVFGVSRDSLKSHENFKAKHAFPFDLMSDPEEQLCQQFDVMKLKNMYGKQVRGIERSTFIFNPEGQLCQEWRKVKVEGHVDEVLDWLRQHTAS
ncbi:MAG: peroxiredoxin [Legionellaceae bacterium]|nr:peroxiredoxin [Legionellaceae bacterium]